MSEHAIRIVLGEDANSDKTMILLPNGTNIMAALLPTKIEIAVGAGAEHFMTTAIIHTLAPKAVLADILPKNVTVIHHEQSKRTQAMNLPIMKYFDAGHLPPHLRVVSVKFASLAKELDTHLPDGAEKLAGLRKLLEAKDCMVRAALEGHNEKS